VISARLPFLDTFPPCRYSAATSHFVVRSLFANGIKIQICSVLKGAKFCGHWKPSDSDSY
jgi:hypothetical protein